LQRGRASLTPILLSTFIATFTLLTFAIFALWVPNNEQRPIASLTWGFPYAAAILVAFVGEIISLPAIAWIVLFAVAVRIHRPVSRARPFRFAALAVLVVLAAGMMTHQLPGFHNPTLIAPQKFSSNAIPFRLHLNFDKTSVGLILLGLCHPRIHQLGEWRKMFVQTGPIALGLIVVIMGLALTFGYVRLDPKFPREAWLWMWVNLCFTCVAEEAVFRGFIQRQLQQAWRNVRGGAWLALGVAAVLFGLAHYPGGPTYVVLATIAGAGYGWAYLRTGRIEASILTHFALNATHFLGFSYPALAAQT
jgi:membrane protease YdiL (CAAX protease family)